MPAQSYSNIHTQKAGSNRAIAETTDHSQLWNSSSLQQVQGLYRSQHFADGPQHTAFTQSPDYY